MSRLIEFSGGNKKEGPGEGSCGRKEKPSKKGIILRFPRGGCENPCTNEIPAKPKGGRRLFGFGDSGDFGLDQRMRIKKYCLTMEGSGKKFSLDWRKLLRLEKVLQSLML